MPFETQSADGGVIITYTGTVSFTEILASAGADWSRPDWDRLRFVIGDVRDAHLDFDAHDAQAAGHMDRWAAHRKDALKVAFVTRTDTRDDLFQAYLLALEDSNVTARRFTDLEAALAWARSESGSA